MAPPPAPLDPTRPSAPSGANPAKPAGERSPVLTDPDVARLREDTPGVVHGLHLNNAGASLPPAPVHEAMARHLQAELELGGYEAEWARRDRIEEAYGAVETLLGAAPRSVAFVENATVAFSQALSSIPFRPGDRILATRHDYVSNQLMLMTLAERFGVEVVHAPDGADGRVDTGAMIEMVHRIRPRLVTMTHIPTNSGIVQDPGPVAQAARAREIPFLLDACQSVGQMPVRVDELGATFVAGTSRKFLRGPRGAGFLWIDPEALEAGLLPLFPDLRGADWIDDGLLQPAPDARRFENWEFSWALVLGMGAAARYAHDAGVEALRDRAWGLAGSLRDRLSELPGVRVLDPGYRPGEGAAHARAGREESASNLPPLSAIVTLDVSGWHPAALVKALHAHRIRSSSLDRGSAVLDFDARQVRGALRLSPHAFNTEGEVDTVVEVLATLAAAPPAGATATGAPPSGSSRETGS